MSDAKTVALVAIALRMHSIGESRAHRFTPGNDPPHPLHVLNDDELWIYEVARSAVGAKDFNDLLKMRAEHQRKEKDDAEVQERND